MSDNGVSKNEAEKATGNGTGNVTKQQVLDWYAKKSGSDKATSVPSESMKNNGEVAQIMDRLHPEVTERYRSYQ